ncbi:MAG TPA: 2Fe-2S iron-sulfur cluster-binding protein, partial [Bacteroidales bacterium]|nr:2Fe-2S iron-sulfur cluster-binding protein [Bacteroidales bacterium]
MNNKIKITIDGKECWTAAGTNILDVARENGIFIPSLCHVEGVKPAGSCRLCKVQINGVNMSAC